MNSEHSLLISPISFKIDQWDGIEPLRSYGKGAKEEAVEQVKAYCEKLAKEAKSLKIPTAYDRHGGTVYCWAVRSHVLREPVDRIAKAKDVVFQTVDTSSIPSVDRNHAFPFRGPTPIVRLPLG